MKTNGDIAAQLIEIAQKAGAVSADALVLEGQSVFVGTAGGALEEAERAEAREAGLRVIIGQHQASVASSDLSDAALAEMADRAVAIARETPEDPWCGLAEPERVGGFGDLAALDLDDKSDPPGPEALEAMARRAEDAALSVEGVTQVEQAHAGYDRNEIAVAASNGFAGSYARTSISVGASAIAGAGLGRERDYAAEARRHQADLPDAEEVGQRAGRRAVANLNPRKAPGGAVPVLFDRRIAASLIGHVLSAANGASVARGSSWLMDQMGASILPDGLDLIEEPSRPRAMASRPFDAEGIASATRPIVTNGRLVRWVLDMASARKLGLETTGNARRGLTGPPAPGVTNVRLTQGPDSRDDLIAAMGTGLIVTSMIGASINATTGTYSRGASGFWVEGGEIAYPVNEITIAGSLPEVIKTLRPANDADPHRASVVPSLLVQGLTIGA